MGEEKKRTAREIIENYDGPAVRIMEVCGTHTHEIFRLGIRKLLPPQVELISGPGCPVCVTPVGFIDEAVWLALEKGVTICTFGDLVRVPGTKLSLAGAREKGAKIRIVYSPADAEKYARHSCMNHHIIARFQILKKLGRNLSFGSAGIHNCCSFTDFYYLC